MINAIRNFFTAPTYESDYSKTQDAKTTHRVALALVFFGITTPLFIVRLPSPTREIAMAATIGGIFIWLFCIWLIKKERTDIAKIFILGINTFNLYAVTIMYGGLSLPTIYVTLFLIALAVLLYPVRGALVSGSINLILSVIIFLLGRSGVIAPVQVVDDPELQNFLIFIFLTISIPVILEIASANSQSYFQRVRLRERELEEKNQALSDFSANLELRVTERTAELEERTRQLEETSAKVGARADQLSAIASVSRSIANVQNLDTLLTEIARLISLNFKYYHVGVFLLDDKREYAVLRATNSSGGKQMLERQHRLEVGRTGLVGSVAQSGRARIALDTGADAVFFDNPDLPDTRSEIALPLQVSGRVIGVLDVQSDLSNDFQNEDIETLSILADQIASAIQTAESFEATQKALQESERIYRSYIRQEWRTLISSQEHAGFEYDIKGVRPVLDTQNAKGGKKLKGSTTIPIKIRDEVIGALSIQGDNEHNIDQDEVDIAEAIAERVALAIENTRLIEDSQRRAAKERTIGDISGRLGSLTDIDSIIQTAIQELGSNIPDADIAIRFNPNINKD